VLATAVALDLLLGEPPARLHPVVWLGKSAALAERHAPTQGRAAQLAWGAVLAGALPAAAAMLGWTVERALRRFGPAAVVAEALALKPSFAVRALFASACAVQRALECKDVPAAREAVRALVSRDPAGLDAPLVAAAAIESLAENVTDSFLAPWLAYALWGLPGAYAYRAVNTLDSMFGYRGRYEYLGKAPARLDDVANLVPARLAAGALAIGAAAGGGGTVGALRGAWRGRGRTASPNAGWTMGAMAGALGLSLEKPGAYVLGDGRQPQAEDITRARRVAAAAGLACLLVLIGAALR
jgi:adenosylcobinamide-phosphate synthase